MVWAMSRLEQKKKCASLTISTLQKALPLLQCKLYNAIGVHMHDLPGLRFAHTRRFRRCPPCLVRVPNPFKMSPLALPVSVRTHLSLTKHWSAKKLLSAVLCPDLINMVKIAQQKLKKPNEGKVEEQEKDLVKISQPVGVFRLVRIASIQNEVQWIHERSPVCSSNWRKKKLVVTCHVFFIKGPLGQCYPATFEIMRLCIQNVVQCACQLEKLVACHVSFIQGPLSQWYPAIFVCMLI